jgi:hypothetical protein
LNPESQIFEPTNPEDTKAEQFYAGAYSRILRLMVVIALLFTVGLWVVSGYRLALGFALGCAIAGLNFYWLKRAVSAFADRVTQAAEGEKRSRGAATRFVLRYALIGVLAYVIFKSSVVSLSGLLAGLFLPVAAILLEAIYETYVALRRGL